LQFRLRPWFLALAVAGVLAAGGAAAAAPVSGPIGSAPLAQGDTGFAVRVLQGDLDQLGYPLVVTGRFGPATTAALRAFQHRHALPATGVLDGATLAVIKQAMGIAGSAPAPAGQGGSSRGAGTGATTPPASTGGLSVGGTIAGHRIVGKINLVATAYGPTLKDNYPYGPVDVFGKPLVPGDVAVDPRVIPLNTHLYVTGYKSPYLPQGGEFAVARDTGGAIKGNRIDMFINGTQAQVDSFGIQHVVAYILAN
jgi:3D (Asp-Asp-Asp) domain-containing protein